MSDNDMTKAIAALSAFQGEVGIVPKTKRATVRHKDGGGQHSFTYADIADVLAHALPIAAKHGLALLQRIEMTANGNMLLHTDIAHKEGGIIKAGVLPAGPANAQMQTIGANLTYVRRYGACLALGLASEEDTDVEMTDNRPSSAPRRDDGPRAGETRSLPPARQQAQQQPAQGRRRQGPPEEGHQPEPPPPEPQEPTRVILSEEEQLLEDEFRMDLDICEDVGAVEATWTRWKTGKFADAKVSPEVLHAMYDYVKTTTARVKRNAAAAGSGPMR